jgi:putative ABC transport system permease protein
VESIGMIWRWAVRDLLRHRGRALLSLLGVAIATALLLDMVLLSGGIERSFGHLLLSRGFQLRMSPPGTLPFDTDATLDRVTPLLAAVRADTGVAAAGAVLGTSVFAQGHGPRAAMVVYGVTPPAQGIYDVVSGSDLVATDTAAVLVGEPAARRLGVRLGDTVRLTGRLDPRIAAAAIERTAVVRGMARFIYDARDQPSIAVALPLAQHLAGAGAGDRASLLMIRMRDERSVESATARLRARFPEVSVNSIADMMVQFRLRLSYFRQLSLILGSIALLVTVLLVGTLLTIGVNERIGEIAALRAVGIARLTVLRQVLAQGFLLTVAGGSLGIGLGTVTARWLDAILTSFPGLPAAISFFVADAGQLARAALTLLLTGVLAGAIPAWRAASTPIAATLRSEAT